MKYNKINIQFIIFAAIAMFVNSSCEKVVPLEVDDVDTKGVLNCLFFQDSTITVKLSHSAQVGTGTQAGPLNNETVRLFANGEFVENLIPFGSGAYSSSILVQTGVDYSVETQTSYGILAAHSKVPDNVDVVSIDTVAPTTIVMDSWIGPETAFIGNITFNDPDEDNFYLMQLVAYDTAFGGYEYYPGSLFYYEYDYRALSSGFGDESYIMTYLYLRFPDEEFAGEQKRYKFGFYPNNLNSTNQYFLKVYSLDKSFYDYLATLETYEQVRYDIFAEPINIYGNVDGGLGIFAGASMLIHPIVVDFESLYE